MFAMAVLIVSQKVLTYHFPSRERRRISTCVLTVTMSGKRSSTHRRMMKRLHVHRATTETPLSFEELFAFLPCRVVGLLLDMSQKKFNAGNGIVKTEGQQKHPEPDFYLVVPASFSSSSSFCSLQKELCFFVTVTCHIHHSHVL